MNSGPAAVDLGRQTDPKVLHIFISYASEDLAIATTIAKSLRDALGDVFAEVNTDRWFLEAGSEFRRQIEEKLERTDVFISLYTGKDKLWTAWEVGYFEHVMRKSSQKRRLVPMFLDSMPANLTNYQGYELNIPPTQLQLDVEEFKSINSQVDETDPLCKFVLELQDTVDEYRRSEGFPNAHRTPEQNAVKSVQNMKLAIFSYLKTTVEATIRPQKQILIRTSGTALQGSDIELPADAQLIPVGQGSTMSAIFGLVDGPRTWSEFLQQVEGNEHAESWRAAIVSVITSSLDNRMDVDNSQLIVSNDNGKAYRVILTSAVRYYDDKREFNLYFVETLRRGDYGDELTTLLLRGIEVSCRFRFLFFEKGSPFSSVSFSLTPIKNVPIVVGNMLKELNLLRKDVRDAGLDHPHVWLRMVNATQFQQIVQISQPAEAKVREVAGRIIAARGDANAIAPLRQELCDALGELEQTVGPGNMDLIRDMTGMLQAATTHTA